MKEEVTIEEVVEKLSQVKAETWIETMEALVRATYVKGFEDGRKAIANCHWCEDCISFDYDKHWCSKWNGKTVADGTCHNWTEKK